MDAGVSTGPEPDPRALDRAGRRPARSPVPGTVLVIVGLLVWLLASLVAGREPRAYTDGGPPPEYVSVTAGHTYSISVPGGVRSLTRLGALGALTCTSTGQGIGTISLPIQVEQDGTKATNQIATFVAPSSGRVHIVCAAAGEVYIDDADGTVDLAGLLILVTIVLLGVGAPLLLSALVPMVAEWRRAAAQRQFAAQQQAMLAASVGPRPGPGSGSGEDRSV